MNISCSGREQSRQNTADKADESKGKERRIKTTPYSFSRFNRNSVQVTTPQGSVNHSKKGIPGKKQKTSFSAIRNAYSQVG